MKLINCDNLQVIPNRFYGGATGSKIAVRYNDSVWMLKCTESLRNKNLHNVEISYANDPISEYLGSHIYELLSIPVHRTKLGSFKNKMCVLCSDDAYPDQIFEFRYFRNSLFDDIDQPSSGMSTKLSDIMEVISLSDRIPEEKALQRFWLMFVVDSLIGNTDRNNGNWAFIYDNDSASFDLYEVYDCGGCLNNKRSDAQMKSDLELGKVNNLALNYTFNYKDNNRRINPFHYIEKHPNKYIVKALELIDSSLLSKMYVLIDSLGDLISETRNRWYKEILLVRLNKLIELKDGIVADEGLPKKMNF